MTVKWDGHTHTKFCRHGSGAEQDAYLERAIRAGFARYSLTEHPPLPDRWVDNRALMSELAMGWDELPDYLAFARAAQESYADRIEIRVGLEMDYLHRSESFSDALLERSGDRVEEMIVSVHFLPGIGGMRCIDFTADDFREGLLAFYGSMRAVVEEYFNHVELALEWAGRVPIAKRLGHVNLIRKFQRELPAIDEQQVERRLRRLIPLLAASGTGVDVNTAGLRVASCGDIYAPPWFVRECVRQGIPCVYGSDAHRPEHVGFAWEEYERLAGARPRGGE